MAKPMPIPNTPTGSLTDHQVDSDDTLLIVSSGAPATLYGDAFSMFDHSQGGNDDLTGTVGMVSLYGDADQMFDHSRGDPHILHASDFLLA